MNLPDNVSSSDPSAPWNQEEYQVKEPRQVEKCLDLAIDLLYELRILSHSDDESLFNPGWELETALRDVTALVENLEGLV
jgi:hypothetical protein